MMDRALGAIVSSSTAPTDNTEAVNRFGMLYQWGRKDPFTPATHTGYIATNNAKEVQLYNANGDAITGSSNGMGGEFKFEARTTETKTTINDLIQNPSTHYDKGDGTNNVPIASTGDLKNDWWNPITKTIYDPCPNGYRIPERGTYGSRNNSPNWVQSDPYGTLTAGYTWNNISFFPASGSRGRSDGKFGSVGTSGYYLISSPRDLISGGDLKLQDDNVYPDNVDLRSYGMSVRCILE